jgi:hypothetical protein
MEDLSMRWACQATSSSKGRVKDEPWAAQGTRSTRTPCSGQVTRRGRERSQKTNSPRARSLSEKLQKSTPTYNPWWCDSSLQCYMW